MDKITVPHKGTGWKTSSLSMAVAYKLLEALHDEAMDLRSDNARKLSRRLGAAKDMAAELSLAVDEAKTDMRGQPGAVVDAVRQLRLALSGPDPKDEDELRARLKGVENYIQRIKQTLDAVNPG